MTAPPLPRVVTSCRSRFHIFDQARELARHGALYRLITDYPASWPERFGVPRDRVHALVTSGFINHGLGRVLRYARPSVRSGMTRWVHDRFSRQLAGLIPADTEYFIGLSSFCLEALEACRRTGIPCAVDHGSVHQAEERRLIEAEALRWGIGVPSDSAPDWIIEKEDREFRTADTVFVLSRVARDSLVRCGVPAARVVTNPCGVDVNTFRPGVKKDSVFRVIQVGSISVGKGVLTLLDAFSRIQRPGAELWLVGGGLKSSGLHAVIDRLRSPGTTFRRPVPQAELAGLYQQASVCVLASVSDGFGMVVSQAMACGRPVIVTENVGARDLIEDGVNGFVVPVGAPEIIAERLRLLHDDPERRCAMGTAARLSVTQGFSWQAYGDRLIEFVRTQVKG